VLNEEEDVPAAAAKAAAPDASEVKRKENTFIFLICSVMEGHMYARIEAAFRITCLCLLYVHNEFDHVVFHPWSID